MATELGKVCRFHVQDVIKDYIDPKPPTKLRNNFLRRRSPFPYQNGRFQFHNETIRSEVYVHSIREVSTFTVNLKPTPIVIVST